MGSLEGRMRKLEQVTNLNQNDYALFDPESCERVKRLWLESPDCTLYVKEVRKTLSIPDTMGDKVVILHHSEKIVHCFLEKKKGHRT